MNIWDIFKALAGSLRWLVLRRKYCENDSSYIAIGPSYESVAYMSLDGLPIAGEFRRSEFTTAVAGEEELIVRPSNSASVDDQLSIAYELH